MKSKAFILLLWIFILIFRKDSGAQECAKCNCREFTLGHMQWEKCDLCKDEKVIGKIKTVYNLRGTWVTVRKTRQVTKEDGVVNRKLYRIKKFRKSK